MTMKRRIFISNTGMVLISLLILFGIGGISVSLFRQEFMNLMEQNAELSDDIYEVQTLLIQQQKTPETWEALSQKLSTYQFELYVSDENHKEQYSNVRQSEWECIEELENSEFASDKVKLFSMENVTIAKCIISSGNMDYSVYAAYFPGDFSFWGMNRGMLERFIIVFFITGVMAIAGLLLCSQIFTKMMIRKIMKPVEELNLAAKRIHEGNFDEPIRYKEQDEFEEVCDTFNTMQQHLKEGLLKNAAYEKARTDMISGISHDLRTPLTSVKAFIKGMLDGIAGTPEKQHQYLSISYQKACDMEVLLQKLFFFSKLETGNMPFFKQKIELGKWMDKYVRDKNTEGQEKCASICLVKEDKEFPVNIDVEQMKRVFDNLIENSIKYADVLNVQITISIGESDQNIFLLFKDNGTGLAEDKLCHVFEQFYRGDESRSSKNEGSGLGLYVCQYIVKEHGGTITAADENGFTVKIELPSENQKGKQ